MNSLLGEDYQINIPKEVLAELPVASFEGKIQMVDHPSGIQSAVADLFSAPIVGFDTETRPNFRRGQNNNVSLVQLSTPDVCYLFRINKIGLVDELKDFLESPDILKVGLSIHDDFHNLSRLRSIKPQGFVELQTYVRDFMIADISLQKIFAILFGRRISKGQRLSNWEAESLSKFQQSYAALDAMACIHIYQHLSSGHFDPAQSPYLHKILPPELDAINQ